MSESLLRNKDKTNKRRILLFALLFLLANSVLAYPNGFDPLDPTNLNSKDKYREIIADAPWRVEPNETQIPVFVFINDAVISSKSCVYLLCDYYTKTFQLDTISLQKDEGPILFYTYHKNITKDGYGLVYNDSWLGLFNVSVQPSDVGRVVPITVIVSGLETVCHIGTLICDTTFLQKKYILNVTVANESLPKLDENYYCGDTHLHSIYTDNPVPSLPGLDELQHTEEIKKPEEMGEIGAPVNATIAALKVMGLKWTMITDHSDDHTDLKGFDSSLLNNITPKADKWPKFRAECSNYTIENTGFTCISGEEISCSTIGIGGNHLLAFDIKDSLRGSLLTPVGLFGKIWCKDAIDNISAQGGLSFVAHPKDDAGWASGVALQKWPEKDYDLNFNGFELWNTLEYRKRADKKAQMDDAFRAYDNYLSTHASKRKYLIAGSDAHGDLNKNLAKPMTCCYMSSPSKANVLDALRNGKCILTSGPALKFSASSTRGVEPVDMADTLSMLDDENLTLTLQWKSTQEFGGIEYAELIKNGELFANSSNIPEQEKLSSSRRYSDSLSWGFHKLFYRAWVNTSKGERAYTNPIWVNVTPVVKNQFLNLSFTVLNDGGASAANFRVQLWRGKPSLDPPLFETFLSLSPGESRTLSTIWNATYSGMNEFNVYVDPENAVMETNEGDNQAGKSFLVTFRSFGSTPNLDSATIYEIYPVNIDARLIPAPDGGQSRYTIGKYVNYSADNPFRKSLVRIYYDESRLGGIPEELYAVHYWDGSAHRWIPLDVTYRNTEENYVEAYTSHFSTFTAIGEARADLNVTSMVISASSVFVNESVNLTARVRNDGVADAQGVYFAFYGVQGYALEQIYNTTMGSLPAGASAAISYVWNVSNRSGNYDVYAVAALANGSEYREYDNAAYGNLTVYETPTTTTSTTSTSTTTTTTHPPVSDACYSGDLLAEGFTDAIPQCG